MTQKSALTICILFFHSVSFSMHKPTITLFDNTYRVDVINPDSLERQIKLTPLTTDRDYGISAHPTVDTRLFIVTTGNSYGMDVFALDTDGKTYTHTVKDHSLPFNPIGAHFMADGYCIIYGQRNRTDRNLLHVKFNNAENEHSMKIINSVTNLQLLGHCPSSNYFMCTEEDRHGERFYTIAHDGTVLKIIDNFAACKVAFSPDGQHYMVISPVQRCLASGGQKRDLYLASIDLDQKKINTITRQYFFELSFINITLSPDGKLFLVGNGAHCNVYDQTVAHLKTLDIKNPCEFGPTSRFSDQNIYSIVDQKTQEQYKIFPKNMPKETIKLLTKLLQPQFFLQYSPRFVLLLGLVQHIESSGNHC